ncbi:hypothetical protein [Microterricola viridarii]|uniref:Uncharacterized protein n=1 Tax=Microterricola viridarii TaxID=412690 RepID=A0A1H1NMR5_9MICO|nr:hypothetical protein [Microterricola viridarii]SDS00341.1 hypothetical protein SAMN04489834_0680 [Microterricola viridarii]
MSSHDDSALLETVRTHRERLRGAFLAGALGTRRTISTLTGKVMGSIVLAAVAVAVCVGVSFVISVLPQSRGGAASTPAPSPASTSEPQPASAVETGTNP